ncbi:MAG TPA: phosphoribosylanthranilate isomerase [Candidatus Altiarchaeales archaeon]|nr:phosphoribosylanthranilate isomerase [Candidatus Altiarchaeales archaeon]
MNVKVCGITNQDDAEMAADAGADLIGVIIDVPVETPRKISLEKACEIKEAVAGKNIVAVLMPEDVGEVIKVVEKLSPYAIQLHGNESIELIGEIRENVDVKIIKAFHVDENIDLDYVRSASEFADMILLDTKAGKKVGGTGVQHDYSIDLKIKDLVSKPLILSGGLNPENVAQAIKAVRPDVVDVSSGVEISPGVKDVKKIGKFISIVKNG